MSNSALGPEVKASDKIWALASGAESRQQIQRFFCVKLRDACMLQNHREGASKLDSGAERGSPRRLLGHMSIKLSFSECEVV